MVSSPLRGSNRPTNTMFWWSAPISSGTGSAAGREQVGVDAVGDDVVGEREVRRQRADAGLRHADAPVQPLDQRPRPGREDVHAGGRRKDAVEGGHRERVVGGVLDRPGGHGRVVGRVHVHDVEAPLAKQLPQAPAQPRSDDVLGLGVVAPTRRVHRDDGADPQQLEGRLGRRLIVIPGGRRHQVVAGDHGHLVAERGERAGLAVDVLGDAAEGRVIEVRDDRDTHAR